MSDDYARCPRCGSVSISGQKKGYDVGAGCCGTILVGPIGLILGLCGSNKMYAHCLKCGYKWRIWTHQSEVDIVGYVKYIIGRMGCHQLTDRCFQIKGRTMPMCSRCLGASIGYIFAIVLAIFSVYLSVILCFVFMAIIFTDWALQEWVGIMSNNWRRLVTGILGGIGVCTIYIKIIIFIIFQFEWGTLISLIL